MRAGQQQLLVDRGLDCVGAGVDEVDGVGQGEGRDLLRVQVVAGRDAREGGELRLAEVVRGVVVGGGREVAAEGLRAVGAAHDQGVVEGQGGRDVVVAGEEQLAGLGCFRGWAVPAGKEVQLG